MTPTARILVKAAFALAMLWQSIGAPAAALMDCCADRQPCCVVTSAQPWCATCVPAATPGPDAMLARAPAARNISPASVQPSLCASHVEEIWRPPTVRFQTA